MRPIQLIHQKAPVPHEAGGLFGHAQNNGAALGVGHTNTRRLEFGVDALGAGLQSGNKVELAHEWRLLSAPKACLPEAQESPPKTQGRPKPRSKRP
jgi:hypothetical protein